MPSPTGQQLHRYADHYRQRTGDDPTFRQAARRFRCRLSEIEDAANDASGFGLPVSITVGRQIPGVGGREFDTMGEWEIETWEEEGQEHE